MWVKTEKQYMDLNIDHRRIAYNLKYQTEIWNNDFSLDCVGIHCQDEITVAEKKELSHEVRDDIRTWQWVLTNS